MAPPVAEAQGLERTSKYPMSTKYGRQNPISERWNSDEQLVAWRAVWADDDEGVKRSKARIEGERNNLKTAERDEIRATVDLEDAAEEFHKLEAQAAKFDPDELMDARLALRPEEESRAATTLKEKYAQRYDPDIIKQ